jgi:MSHA pilin protein MshC
MQLVSMAGDRFDAAAPAQRGFTLVELVVIMVILGILAVVAMPRFVGRQVFDTRGAFDEVGAALRYARQQAVAQRREVCVALAADGLGITRAPLPPPASCEATRFLLNPATGADYRLPMPAGVTLAARGATAALPATVRFDALGRSAAAGVRVNGDGSLCLAVEAETGYSHAVACP